LLARLASPNAEDRKLYEQAIKDQEDLLNLDQAEPENRIKLARYLNNLAMLEAKSNTAKAERSFRKARNLLAGLDAARASLPDARWQEARASNNLATILARKGHNDEAGTILKRARDTLDRLTLEFPRIVQYRRELASIFNNLAVLGQRTENRNAAAEAYRQSADQLKQLARKNPQVPDYRENQDIALFQLGLLQGSGGQLLSSQVLTRAQMAVLLSRMATLEAQASGSGSTGG
jgi:tetratricopeptide (TPR) repeat protein